ncbi:hypothetical protein [Sutcliffiella horikoshii]|uniref:hypothetical protein n=1 Tax=Sutcliffiella horikoshii TaxID=79883 RepID=UPI00384D117C
MSCQCCKKKKCCCKPKPKPKQCNIHLFVHAVVTCEDVIEGVVECDGRPVGSARVVLSVEPAGITVTPNPVFTDERGNFQTTILIPDDTPETPATITATTFVKEQEISTSLNFIAVCEESCEITLFPDDTRIICDGFIDGRVTCGGVPIEGAQVFLESAPDIIIFNENGQPTESVFTDSTGVYMAGVSVPPGTPETTVTITATTTVGSETVFTEIEVEVVCDELCQLTLTVPPFIDCSATLTGNISCNGVPQSGALIFFESYPAIVRFEPNPATSDADGNFTVDVIVNEGIENMNVMITARTTVDSRPIVFHVSTAVECLPEDQCRCKFRLGIQGNRATALVDLFEPSGQSTLTGFINVTIVQCFTGGPNCNPAVDNFNISFTGAGGQTINFVQGRRVEIFCENNNTTARVVGMASATGNQIDGVFEVIIELNILGSSNQGFWTIIASDNLGTVFFTQFTATLSPVTSISNCGLLGVPLALDPPACNKCKKYPTKCCCNK